MTTYYLAFEPAQSVDRRPYIFGGTESEGQSLTGQLWPRPNPQ